MAVETVDRGFTRNGRHYHKTESVSFQNRGGGDRESIPARLIYEYCSIRILQVIA